MNRFEIPEDNNYFDKFFETVLELFDCNLYELNKEYIHSEEFLIYAEMLYNKGYTPKTVIEETTTFL